MSVGELTTVEINQSIPTVEVRRGVSLREGSEPGGAKRGGSESEHIPRRAKSEHDGPRDQYTYH